jgi:hypothetical protein
MAETLFFYLALADFVLGISVVAPLVCVINLFIPYSTNSIPLYGVHAIVVIGLIWTLLTACTNNTGISWN